MLSNQPVSVVINGENFSFGMWPPEPLVRAVIVSLFSWRRANPDDELPGDERMGWWGDTYPTVANDRIGSRLWLLSRSKLTEQVRLKAKEYAEEALRWLIDDGIASRIEVESERQGLSTLVLSCRIYRADSLHMDIRFQDTWSFLQ